MRRRRPWSTSGPFAAYTGLCVLALAYIAWASIWGGGRFELAGLAFVLLGLPWSLLLTFAILAIKSSSAWLIAIALFASCGINAWLLHTLGARRAHGEPR